VSFTISFIDMGSGGKNDSFGIQIQYSPKGDEPKQLPNSSQPQSLKGGDIKVT
jgi:hypothetical protein